MTNENVQLQTVWSTAHSVISVSSGITERWYC